MSVSDRLSAERAARDPIALVGIGCRFPGGANDPDRYWRMICDGVDAVTEIPLERGNTEAFFGTRFGSSEPGYSRWGGFIDCVDQFDPEFFSISLREAPCMDPQQRLLLEAAWEAIEDGGLVLDDALAARTGVFVGISTNDYQGLQATPYDYSLLDVHTVMGCAASIAANRVSYSFNLRGPSIALDTACSSSLVAVHVACRSLWEGECDVALAGGVNALLGPGGFLLSMLSPDGRCKAFDERANGFVRAEGVGIVVLEPLRAAVASGHPIYAVIRGTAMNQDGRTTGITVPNPEAQARLVREACRVAGVRPEAIHYVEAHGTGTPVGDPIEAHALGAALGAGRDEGRPCVVGSVKTNIGHLEAAAGVAGLIKVALMLTHRAVPPNLHLVRPNPHIDFRALRLRVPLALEPLPEGPILAGVNSFGFGGVNAHAVLSSWLPGDDAPAGRTGETGASGSTRRLRLLPLSARSAESLVAMAGRHADFLAAHAADDSAAGARWLRDVCHTASRHRKHHEHRLAVVGATPSALADALSAFARGEPPPDVRAGEVDQKRSLVFLFGGQGPQWWGMARGLMHREPVFRNAIEECDRLQRALGGWSLLDELTADEGASRLHETARAQPAIFALQAGLAALWRSWGIVPDVVVGHSVGEIAAALVSGALDLASAVRVIYHRGRCMGRASDKGGMLAVGVSEREAAALVATAHGRVCVAAINGPRSVTLAGDADALGELAAALERQSVFCRRLKVNYAFHSPQMDPVHDELMAALDDLEPGRPQIPMWSTVTGASIGDERLDAGYWWRNVRNPVRFSAAVSGLVAQGHRAFLELSPHPVLAVSVAEALDAADTDGLVTASLRRGDDDERTLMTALAALHVRGFEPAWDRVHPDGGRCIRLPRYAWRHRRYWQEAEEITEMRQRPAEHPLLGRAIRSALPHWEKKIGADLRELLADHRVQGRIVFPAAAFLEMALAAGKQLFGDDGCALEEVEILKPLFVPDSGEAPRLQLTYDPQQREFSIASLASDTQKFWIQHCVGKLGPVSERAPEAGPAILAPQAGAPLPGDVLYPSLEAMGLHYGPAFRRAQTIWCADGEALGVVELAPGANPEAFQFHPALLDGCFHAVLGTGRPDGHTAALPLLLPHRFGRIRLHARPTSQVRSHVRVRRRTPKFLEVDVRVLDGAGRPCLEIEGFRLTAVEGARTPGEETAESSLYELDWRVQALPGAAPRVRPPDFLPDLAALTPSLVAEADRLVARGWLGRLHELDGEIDALCASYVLRAFEALGLRFETGATLTRDALRERVAPQHARVVELYARMLERQGVLAATQGGWRVRAAPAPVDPDELWRALFRKVPAYLPELMGIHTFGRDLARVLSGEIDALALLFGETSFLDLFYADSVTVRDPYGVIQKVVDEVVTRRPEGRRLRIVEVGAGTGGLTSNLLSHLPAEHTDYVFTDVTPLFLGKAEHRLRSYPFVRYQSLDLDRSPIEQGFEAHGFDVVLASEVLHATTDLRRTLGHVRELLAPRGLLVALELDTPPRWLDLVFALTRGWWSFTDGDLRRDTPLLKRHRWVELLAEAGFHDATAICETDGAHEPIQVVLLARGPEGDDASTRGAPAAEPPREDAAGDWLVLADDAGVAQEIDARLAARGGTCHLVFAGPEERRIDQRRFQVRPAQRADLRRVLATVGTAQRPLRGVVFLWGLEPPSDAEPTSAELDAAQVRGCHGLTELVKELVDERVALAREARLWLITRATQPAGHDGCRSVAQAPLWGLGRVIMNEHPRLACRLVDLSATGDDAEISALVEELVAGDAEEEIALRGETRYVLRIARARRLAPPLRIADATTPFRLEIARPGVLEALQLRPLERRPPGPGEVEIEVEAASLNFRDVMKALGIYPRELEDSLILGDECAGRIVATGPDVTELRPGDEVLAFAGGSLASHVITKSHGVIHRPPSIRPEEAVTIPVAYITTVSTLLVLARLRPGERVLIHAGAGGVGLAAIQIAQRAGAEVFATAGSPRKRELLCALGVKHVMDSRSLAFADEVMRITDGEGVDVVLNSLAGEALAKGMGILRPNGRFLEIGKRDVFQNTKLGLRQLRSAISLHVFDLLTALDTQTKEMREICLEATRDIDAGILHALPVRIFPIGRIGDAFRFMMESAHVGKIVLRVKDRPVTLEPRVDASGPLFRADATYLVTGGLGGLGLAVARWMVDNGARNLVLVGRSGTSREAARRAVDELRGLARVEVGAVDVAVEGEVVALLARIDATMPPLKGIVHGAMVLDDGVVTQLDAERFRRVMGPKMLGAWNLHRHTSGHALDLFVTFSSFTSMTGNPGQGNYAAGNAFLDGLAHYRRGQGLAGLNVNWGSIREVGYIARTTGLNEALSRFGVRPVGIRAALDVLGRLLRAGTTQIGVMDTDWQRLVQYITALQLTPRLSAVLASSAASPEVRTSGGVLRERLLGATGDERRELVTAYLREQAARVLRAAPEHVDPERPLTDLGLDSLMAVELSNRLEGELGIALPMGKLTAGRSITHLADALVEVLSAAHAAPA